MEKKVYSRDNEITRLKNQLFKLRVDDEEVIGLFSKPTGMHIYVNPKVYYKGNNTDDIKALMNMFKAR